MIVYIGNKLQKHGYSPTTIDTLSEKLKSKDLKIIAVSSQKNKILRIFEMLSTIFQYRKTARKILIDTYSTTNFWYAVSCGQLSRMLGLPYVFIFHGGNLPERFEKTSFLIKRIFSNSELNIVPSLYLFNQLSKFKLGTLKVIPNSIDLDQYKFKKREMFKPNLLWVRSFSEVYNPKLAVEVLGKMLKFYPDSRLCMVGAEKDGSLENLRTYCEENNLPVVFKGHLSKSHWIDLSEEYDIFINTSRIDNTPVSVLEAMALGMVIVTTNVGGIPYILKHNKNAILVNSDDALEMAEAIEYLLENQEVTNKIAHKARLEAEKYDWENVKAEWMKLLS
ncbi:glycosyltransferase family 4 protein [Gramella sp. AN32]|uniref:Glycosyltransferase family 4 protein n=1 Tax=Christiangramia antarctica TaxID=2058158 RepID=A0ABW5X777_9FLAO|nr:glycosyltransferase family 4 protein [Gramella sp. AN32]